MKSPYKLIKTDKLEMLKADYQKILESNLAATSFIKEIENGNLDAVFSSEVNEEEGLTKALLAMQEQLQKIAEDEKERNWATQGLALFAEILRADNDNSGVFYQKIISNLVKYLNANQGGLFLIDDEDSSNIGIELVSCYAYNRQKFLNKRINPGEGLIGQCYLEKETIFMTDIPQSYVQITSGLGTANPGCLLIVPLKVNEQVHGFVELASFHVLKPFQVEFLERLGESIASSIATVKINHRTKRLLEDTQQQAEEMRAQEEEMRQNMEELSATQEEMGRVSAEMEGQLSAINEAMATIEFDLNGNILVANDNFLKLLEYSLNEIEGKHHRMFVENSERQSSEYLEFWKQLAEGKGSSGEFKRISKSGKEIYIRAVYNPIFDPEGRTKKILKIAYDITLAKEMELQIKNQLEEAHAQEEVMRQNMEELSATQEEMEKIIREAQAGERYTRELMGASKDSIFVVNRDYILTDFNAVFLRPLKHAGLQIEKGDSIFKIFSEEQRDSHKDFFDRAFSGESFDIQEHIKSLNLYYFTSFSPLKNPEGEIIAAAVFAKDITELVIAKQEAEQLLKESQQQAEILQAQEEVMRQNMEELSATQEEMEKIMREVELSERHTRELMGASKDTIFVVDKEYRLIDFNVAFSAPYKELGINIEKGFNIFEIPGKSEGDKHSKLFDRAFKGECFEVTEHIPGPDLYFLSTYSPLRTIEGKVYAVAVFARNVTEMIKAGKETEKLLEETQQQTEEIKAQEEELRQNMEELSATQEEMEKVMLEIQEQEQHFGELLNGSGESIFAIDPHYKVISWNKAFEATFGRNGNGISKGMDILEVFPPEERQGKADLFKRVLKGETVEISNPFVNNGVKCEVNARHIPLRNKSGETVAVGIFLKVILIEEQTPETQNAGSRPKDDMEQEENTDGHEKSMKELVTGFNVAYNIVNRKLELTEFNTAFKKLFKKHFHVNVQKGMHISAFMKNEKEREETKANIEKAFKGESLKQTQKFVVGDKIGFILMKYEPLKNKKGEVEGVGVFTEDISEIIRMMEKNKELIISGSN